ncbi:MAG: RusA family crossover junction endodeoxyribonuclease [Anaerolineae bacterium]
MMAEIQRVQFSLPMPPSINRQYARAGARRILSKEARSFKKATATKIHRLRVAEVITDAFIQALQTGWVGIFMDMYFESPLKRDLDGGLKITQDAILDALKVNDNRVVDIHLIKRIDPLKPRVEIELEAIPEWEFSPTYVHLGGGDED